MHRGGLPTFQSRGTSSVLIVMLHAYAVSPKSLRYLRDVITAEDTEVGKSFANADIFVPSLPWRHVWSMADPIRAVGKLIKAIDGYWEERVKATGRGYEQIILIGHSNGALLARKVYVYANGETADAPFESIDTKGAFNPRTACQIARPWAKVVSRIILMAAINRGWTISNHMSIVRAVTGTIGMKIGELSRILFGKAPVIFATKRGSSFITQLRLQWLAMQRASKEAGNGRVALTIQLLGTQDDVVGPDDNIDLVTGGDFVYLEVPQSGHSSVVRMDESEAGRARRSKFELSLLGTRGDSDEKKDLNRHQIEPSDSDPQTPDPSVKKVVFVIHGIRDLGYWTSKIAQRVQTVAKKQGMRFKSVTSSYGYFAMLPFIWPSTRRQKVEWLMDRYAEARARYPNAAFSYIGHSNGTYLLAKALTDYSSVKFERVLFAGSVVRTDYGWSDMKRGGRVGQVLNYVATRDWVVAIFPKTIQTLRWQDLGGAGHDGFKVLNDNNEQVRYVEGAHSAAIVEDNWDRIAQFIVNGTFPAQGHVGKQFLLVKCCGWIGPIIWLVLIFGAFIAGSFILFGHPLPSREGWFDLETGHTAWWRVLGFAAYLWVVRFILFKV